MTWEPRLHADDDADPEGPGPADLTATPCPECRTFVDADRDRCVACGAWLTGDPPQRSSPLWFTVAVVGVALVLLLGLAATGAPAAGFSVGVGVG